jgi:hypothetical protein
MSWSLEIIGTKEACTKAVDAEAYIPAFVKEYMRVAIDMASTVAAKFQVSRQGQKWGVHVKTNGHIDDQNFSNDTVVRPVRME